MPMNTWMIPKNKRTLSHIPGTLAAFAAVNEGRCWMGNRDLQSTFEKMLERSGLKGGGNQYDPNSGGARTYEAQLDALGLIFWKEEENKKHLYFTLAGEAILNGENPTVILQHQLMKYQYPSPYSIRSNVNISSDFQIRPFQFVMRLLIDEDIRYLDREEFGLILLPYAKKDSDFEKIKKMILNFRNAGCKFTFPETFMEDTSSTRTMNHTKEERVKYLIDKANIFVNYLDSCQFIIRPESGRISADPDAVKTVEEYIRKNKPLISDPENSVRFQRIFGVDPKHTKDTRLLDSSRAVSAEIIYERSVMSKFFDIASQEICTEITAEVIQKVSNQAGVPLSVTARILEKRDPDGLNYFEENYIAMSSKGREEAIDFEKATAELFERMLGYKAKHVGQVKPKGRGGGNPDVIVISEAENYCGILDAKAYISYGLTNDHEHRMEYDYIPNVGEHSEGTELKFFAYISGNFASNFPSGIRKFAESVSQKRGKELHGCGITARNLIRLCQRVKAKQIPHDVLGELFSCDSVITLEKIEAVV